MGYTRVLTTGFGINENQGIRRLVVEHPPELKLCMKDTIYTLPTQHLNIEKESYHLCIPAKEFHGFSLIQKSDCAF